MFCFFAPPPPPPQACGMLAPWPGIEPAPPALEGEVLTTGPLGNSQEKLLNYTFKWTKGYWVSCAV